MDGEVDLPATLPAVARQRHPAVGLATVETPGFLPRERPEIPDQIGQEVVLDDPLGHVGLVDRPQLARQLQLGVHLVHHRVQRLVRREARPHVDTRRLVGVLEAVVLVDRIQRVLAGLDVDGLGIGHLAGRLVELAGIAGDDVHVVGLVVDLGWIDPR